MNNCLCFTPLVCCWAQHRSGLSRCFEYISCKIDQRLNLANYRFDKQDGLTVRGCREIQLQLIRCRSCVQFTFIAERMNPLAPCIDIFGWVLIGRTWCSLVQSSSILTLAAIFWWISISCNSARGCTYGEKTHIVADDCRVNQMCLTMSVGWN